MSYLEGNLEALTSTSEICILFLTKETPDDDR